MVTSEPAGQAPADEQAPTAGQVPAAEQAPADEQVPAAGQVPAAEQGSAPRQPSAARPAPAAGQAPTAGQDGLVDTLAQAAFMTMAVLTKVAADNDLSLTQLRVLAILRDRRLRMTALADYLGLEKSTMTGLVDRAEKRGLLQRAPSASDGRAVDVFLSPAGAELAGRLHTGVVGTLSPVTSKLAPPEQRLLQTLLEQMLSPHGS